MGIKRFQQWPKEIGVNAGTLFKYPGKLVNITFIYHKISTPRQGLKVIQSSELWSNQDLMNTPSFGPGQSGQVGMDSRFLKRHPAFKTRMQYDDRIGDCHQFVQGLIS